MIKNKLKLLFPLIILTILNSCVMTKTYTSEEKKMKSSNEKVIVIMSDGSEIVGKSLILPSGKKGKENLGQVDDREVNFTNVVAYENKSAFYKKFGPDKNSVWVKQLKRGKINLYYYDVNSSFYSSGQNFNTTTTHFVFQKENEQLTQASIAEIADMLKDNIKAYKIFAEQFGVTDKKVFPKQLENHPKVLFRAIDIYNGNL